jgi:hypothetical protein
MIGNQNQIEPDQFSSPSSFVHDWYEYNRKQIPTGHVTTNRYKYRKRNNIECKATLKMNHDTPESLILTPGPIEHHVFCVGKRQAISSQVTIENVTEQMKTHVVQLVEDNPTMMRQAVWEIVHEFQLNQNRTYTGLTKQSVVNLVYKTRAKLMPNNFFAIEHPPLLNLSQENQRPFLILNSLEIIDEVPRRFMGWANRLLTPLLKYSQVDSFRVHLDATQ